MRSLTAVTLAICVVLLSACAAPVPTPTPTAAASPAASPTMTPSALSASPGPTTTATEFPSNFPMQLERIGQFGGSAIGVALRDNTAFSIVGPRVVAFDISNPYNPVVSGRSEIMEDWLRGLAVVDHYVVTGGRSGTLWVLDAPPAGDPQVVTKFDAGDYINCLVVSGHFAYLSLWKSGLLILDLTDPTVPKIAGRLAVNVADVMLSSGNLVFMGPRSIDIIDVADPARPRKVSQVTGAGGEYDTLAVSGNTVYAGSNVYDITDPAAPKLIGQGGRYSDGVLAIGHLVFGLEGQVYDFTDPDNPVLVGRPLQLLDNPEAYSNNVVVRGHFLYRSGYGLQIYDLSVPPTQTAITDRNDEPAVTYNWARVGFVRTDVASVYFGCCSSSFTGALHVIDHYLYTASMDGDFVWDIKDPANPVLIHSFDRPSTLITSHQTGKGLIYHRAYFDEGYYLFLDTQNPASPTLAKVPIDWGSGNIVGVNGDTLVFDSSPGTSTDPTPDVLQIYDVSNPYQPTLVGSLSPILESADYSLAGDYVIAHSRTDQPLTMIVDISDPAHPRPLDSQTFAIPSGRIMWSGQSIIVVHAGELRVYPRDDLTTLLSTVPVPDGMGAWYADGFAWLSAFATENSGPTLTMVDVRDSAHPSVLARACRDGDATAVYGDTVYVEVPLSGVYIFKLVPN